MQVISIDPSTNIRTPVNIESEVTQYGYDSIIPQGDYLWMTGMQPLVYNTATNQISGWPSSMCPGRPFEPYYPDANRFGGATVAGTDVWVACLAYDNYRDGYTQPGYIGSINATDPANPGPFTMIHDLDPLLFGRGAGAMTYLDGTIWAVGADSTVVGHSMLAGLPSVTYVVPVSRWTQQLLNAFGSVWAIGGQTVTRIVPEPPL